MTHVTNVYATEGHHVLCRHERLCWRCSHICVNFVLIFRKIPFIDNTLLQNVCKIKLIFRPSLSWGDLALFPLSHAYLLRNIVYGRYNITYGGVAYQNFPHQWKLIQSCGLMHTFCQKIINWNYWLFKYHWWFLTNYAGDDMTANKQGDHNLDNTDRTHDC